MCSSDLRCSALSDCGPMYAAPALLQEIGKLTDKKIRYVVASHYHADHIYGLQAFKDHTDALIVAQERSGEYKDNDAIADEKASQRLDQRRGALYPFVDGNTRVVPPDITFRERMTIALGDRRLTLLYAGPAGGRKSVV